MAGKSSQSEDCIMLFFGLDWGGSVTLRESALRSELLTVSLHGKTFLVLVLLYWTFVPPNVAQGKCKCKCKQELLSPLLDCSYADRLTLTLDVKQTYEEALSVQKSFKNSHYLILRNISSPYLSCAHRHEQWRNETQWSPNCAPRIPRDPRQFPRLSVDAFA